MEKILPKDSQNFSFLKDIEIACKNKSLDEIVAAQIEELMKRGKMKDYLQMCCCDEKIDCNQISECQVPRFDR